MTFLYHIAIGFVVIHVSYRNYRTGGGPLVIMDMRGEGSTISYYLDCLTKENILKLAFKLFYVSYLCLATKLQTKRF